MVTSPHFVGDNQTSVGYFYDVPWDANPATKQPQLKSPHNPKNPSQDAKQSAKTGMGLVPNGANTHGAWHHVAEKLAQSTKHAHEAPNSCYTW
jgi:hypothetical protein